MQNKIGFGLILFSIGIVFYGLLFQNDKRGEQITKPFVQSNEYRDRVNEHLQITSQKAKLEQEKAKNESYKSLQAAQNGPQLEFKPDNEFRLNTENQWDELAHKLRGSSGESELLPSEEIQYELFQEQQVLEYSEAYKEAFAKAFVENARRHGWEVKLDSSYRVVSVKKIVTSSNPTLFEE